jgi:hypothetical protein
MRTFIGVPHRAQASASRHDLDCCSGLITLALGGQARRRATKGRAGTKPNGLWDELPECSGSAHRLIVLLVAYC